MNTFESKFENFAESLKNTHNIALYNEEALTLIKAAMVLSGFSQTGGNIIVRKKKKLNGYNLYMKDRMEVLKETVTDSNSRMTQISKEWKKLEEPQKQEWKDKAVTLAETPVKAPAKIKEKRKSHKWSGYQLFVSENMAKMVDVKPKERMSEIGKLWKSQTPEQKDAFKLKASERPQTVEKVEEVEESEEEATEVVAEKPAEKVVEKEVAKKVAVKSTK